jgi:hypothetical protein
MIPALRAAAAAAARPPPAPVLRFAEELASRSAVDSKELFEAGAYTRSQFRST